MTWQRRLFELACAGGLASACTPLEHPIPCGNANPDPCICDRSPPDTPQCRAEDDCTAEGCEWVIDLATSGSAGLEGSCSCPVVDGAPAPLPDADVVDAFPPADGAGGGSG